MIFNIPQQTVDGKFMNLMAIKRLMEREMDEGRDCHMTNGKETWIQYAREWKGREWEETDELATTSDVRTTTDGQTTSTLPSPEKVRSDGQTVDGQEMGDGIGQETGQGQEMTTGQVTMMDERTIFTVTPDGQTLTDGRTMTTDGQTIASSMMEEPLMAVETEVPSIADEVDPLALSPAASTVAGDCMISHYLVEDSLSASPSPSRRSEHAVPVVDDGSAVDMRAEEDPLMCPLSSSFVSVGEADSGPTLDTPRKLAFDASMTPRRVFLSADENTPSVSGRVCDGSVESDMDTKVDTIASGKRVVGRRHAVIEDDVESLSSASVTSVGLDSSSMASSSRVLRKGVKRGRKVSKDKDPRKKGKTEGSSEENREKKKGKKKETGRKETPEERESCGPCGEPKGLVEHTLEDMSSPVLGGAILDWANKIDEIRLKSKNIHGKLSGEIKNCVAKIKEGTILMGIRLEATGDPHFLRMRNAELASQLKEAKGENARLEEQLRRMSSGTPSPLRKRKATKAAAALDASQGTMVDSPIVMESRVLPSLKREAFPPLPQRPPRDVKVGKGGDRMVSEVRDLSPPSMTNRGSEDVETGTEVCLTQQINALVAARELEREKKRKEQGKEHLGLRDESQDVGVDKDRRKDIGGKRQTGDGRVGPRIISNVQLVPSYKERLKDEASSSAVSASETGWRVVGGRRRRMDSPYVPNKTDPRALLRDVGMGNISDLVERRAPPLSRQQPKVRMPRPPLSSAVTITGRVEGFSYAAAMKSARESISLETLGIESTRIRKTLNGGLLIEVSGEGSKAKAEELVTRLRGVLKDSAAISCPSKKRELRVVGFDESVSAEEIAEVLCKSGGCSLEDVKIGSIRTLSNGLGMVWVQLPVAAAAKVAEEERIRLGWTVARVELLNIRPLQCYRCWSYGHVQNTCRSVIDRRAACFKCGQQGHLANKCQNAAHCVLCQDAGLETAHRLGGPQCMAQMLKKK